MGDGLLAVGSWCCSGKWFEWTKWRRTSLLSLRSARGGLQRTVSHGLTPYSYLETSRPLSPFNLQNYLSLQPPTFHSCTPHGSPPSVRSSHPRANSSAPGHGVLDLSPRLRSYSRRLGRARQPTTLALPPYHPPSSVRHPQQPASVAFTGAVIPRRLHYSPLTIFVQTSTTHQKQRRSSHASMVRHSRL